MARLLSPPVDLLKTTSIEPLSGPRTVGASSTQALGGFMQTTAGAFGLWRFRFSFPPMKGVDFRRFRGWLTALHGGANATRWDFFDPDMMTYQEAGVDASNFEIATGVPWSNGEPWSNAENWAISPPVVAVATAAAIGATEIALADDWWGHELDLGDRVGFFPLHFGVYEITQVMSAGVYRVWPPLRKAITTDSYATLKPVLALRLEGEEAASATRGLVAGEGLSATLVEVLDYDARDYFAD